MRIGVDLGGTKIELVALDPAGKEPFRRRVDTPRGDYRGTLRAVAGLVSAAERALGVTGLPVGVGHPGALSAKTGKMKNANSTCLNGKSLGKDLEKLLRRPVRMANDADCFALSEAADGAARGAAVVFGVILGTGVGGGIVVGGRAIQGPNHTAGEWGHNPLPWPSDDERPGSPCYCGKSGCIETFLSGPGLERDFAARAGRRLDAPAISKRAEAGDPAAKAALERYEDRLARALATVINVLDPDAIVLGGGLSNLKHLYRNVPRRWGRYVFSDDVRTRFLANKYGDSSGVRGAARLWHPD